MGVISPALSATFFNIAHETLIGDNEQLGAYEYENALPLSSQITLVLYRKHIFK